MHYISTVETPSSSIAYMLLVPFFHLENPLLLGRTVEKTDNNFHLPFLFVKVT